MSYEQYCGECWNLERCQAMQAVEVARGLIAAQTARPDPAMVDAMATRPSQVGALAAAIDAARQEAETRANISRGIRY